LTPVSATQAELLAKFAEVSLIPMANFPPVSLIPMVLLDLRANFHKHLKFFQGLGGR
jgi:hypothetical protein